MGNHETERTDHARMRSSLQPLFSPGRMRALEPRVESLVGDLLDDLARSVPPVDLLPALALPLPVLVICELLGVPYADRGQFRDWTRAAADLTDQAASHRGLAELFAYGQQLVARKRHDPGEDVISELCQDDELSDGHIATLAMSLLFAGYETTTVQIGFGVLFLLTNPEPRRALREDPSLAGRAVEEILRAPAKSNGVIPRYAHADVEVDGTIIEAGDLMLLDVGSANHDPGVFDEPERFDVTRTGPSHLTFGHGLHYCLGAPLARIELRAVITGLVHRFPTMRLAIELDDLETRTTQLTGGLAELPVTWV